MPCTSASTGEMSFEAGEVRLFPGKLRAAGKGPTRKQHQAYVSQPQDRADCYLTYRFAPALALRPQHEAHGCRRTHGARQPAAPGRRGAAGSGPRPRPPAQHQGERLRRPLISGCWMDAAPPPVHLPGLLAAAELELGASGLRDTRERVLLKPSPAAVAIGAPHWSFGVARLTAGGMVGKEGVAGRQRTGAAPRPVQHCT